MLLYYILQVAAVLSWDVRGPFELSPWGSAPGQLTASLMLTTGSLNKQLQLETPEPNWGPCAPDTSFHLLAHFGREITLYLFAKAKPCGIILSSSLVCVQKVESNISSPK